MSRVPAEYRRRVKTLRKYAITRKHAVGGHPGRAERQPPPYASATRNTGSRRPVNA